MPWVYLLRCADDIVLFRQHSVISNSDCSNMRLVVSTHSPRVVDRLRSFGLKNVSTLSDAYVLEHKIKGWRREKKLALIKGNYSVPAACAFGVAQEARVGLSALSEVLSCPST